MCVQTLEDARIRDHRGHRSVLVTPALPPDEEPTHTALAPRDIIIIMSNNANNNDDNNDDNHRKHMIQCGMTTSQTHKKQDVKRACVLSLALCVVESVTTPMGNTYSTGVPFVDLVKQSCAIVVRNAILCRA